MASVNFMNFLHALTGLFGGLALLVIMGAGFLIMFNAKAGRELLKNVGVALVLFVLGSMLLQAFCSPYWHRVP